MKQQINRRIATMGVKHIQPNSDTVAKVSKSQGMLKRAVDRPCKELKQPSPLVDASSNKLDSRTPTSVTTCKNQRFCSCRSCVEYSRRNEIKLQFVQKNKADDPFLSKRFVGGTNQQCKQLLDALGIFNSNKELFINLLQDPNSLLIKDIEDSTDPRAKKQQMRTFFGGTLSENKIIDVGESEVPVHSQDLKVDDRLPSEESDDAESLERIVVLKPTITNLQHSAGRSNDRLRSLLQSHSNFINDVESDKQTLFSFGNIKRKMRQAMRVGKKEGECLATHGMSKKTPQVCRTSKDVSKHMVMEVTGKNSHSNIQPDGREICNSFQDSQKRGHLGKAFHSRNGDKTASTSGSTGNNSESAFTSHLQGKKSKKHGGGREVSRKMRAKPWGWMICFSDDDISPAMKSGCHIAGQVRHSHFSNKKIVCDKKTILQNEKKESSETRQMDNLEASEKRGDDDELHGSNTESNISDFTSPDVKMDDDPIFEGTMKMKDIATVYQEGNNSFEASSELDNICDAGHCESTSKTTGLGEDGSFELSRLDSPLEAQPSTFLVDAFPSSSSRLQKMKDPNGLYDREDQPLPTSIHDTLLVDASISPGFAPGTTESSAEPLDLIISEEHWSTGLASSPEVLDPAISTSVDCCVSISEYVLELLQASRMNWNELLTECHSSVRLQSLALINKMKVFNGQLCGDCVLLFDYINEVLEDVLCCYIGCSPWLSSCKDSFQASDKERVMYHEVMKRVDRLQQPPPETLEHLVIRDLMGSRTWINGPAETEDIVTIVTESILEELTIGSIVHLAL